MTHLLEIPGDPGDIAIENINITQNPRHEPGRGDFLRRTLTVRRLDTSGEWKIIGHINEHFGADPDDPDEMGWMVPHPNGSMYSEPWFTEEEREKAFSKWFSPGSGSWSLFDFLLEHYKTKEG